MSTGKELVREYWFIDGYTIVEMVPPEEFVFYVWDRGSTPAQLPAGPPETMDMTGWQPVGHISADAMDSMFGGHRGVDVAGAYIDEIHEWQRAQKGRDTP